ncbi:MAG: isochorismatase family cysteine hydrolase [archaeon]
MTQEHYEQMITGMATASNLQIDPKKTALLVIDVLNDGCDEKGAFAKMGFDISLLKRSNAKILEIENAARKAGIPVIAVETVYDRNYLYPSTRQQFEGMGITGDLSAKGSWGAQILPEIRALADYILVKSHFSGFAPGKTFLYQLGNREAEEYLSRPASEDEALKAAGKKIIDDYWKEASQEQEDVTMHLQQGGVVSLDNYLRANGIDTLIITGASTHVCVDSTVAGASERGYHLIEPIDAVAAEGMRDEGFERHYTFLSNHGLFKSQLTTTSKLIEKLQK